MISYKKLNFRLILLGLIFCGALGVNGQHKSLRIEDAFNPAVYPTSLKQLQWAGNASNYAYVKDDELIIGIPGKSKKEESVLKLEALNAALEAQKIDKLKRFPAVELSGIYTFTFIHKNKLWEYTIKPEGLKSLAGFPEDAENTEFAPITKIAAYTKANNLYIMQNGIEKAVTLDEDKGIVNGQTVSRNEFGIKDGIFWSPKGNLLAFYRKDERNVSQYPLVNIEPRVAEIENTRYPMAGMNSEEISIGIYDVGTGKTTFLKTTSPVDRYFTNLSWSPDQKTLYIFELNRDQNHLELISYDVQTGEKRIKLFEETNPRYVEPEEGLHFLNLDNSKFICQSERDGWNHLYLYDVTGKLIKQLTTGKWMVKEIISITADDKKVFFTSTEASPTETQLYSLDMTSGKINRVTKTKGTHNVTISKDGKYIIDTYSNLDIALEVLILESSGKAVQTLVANDNPLKFYKIGKTTIFTIKSSDGSTDLYCRMILPPDFDGSKKYPALIYVYGGPHAQMVTESWLGGAGLYLNYMASQGYVVFTLDNRGTANRGFEFESCIHRNLGKLEVDDQMAGVNYLKSQSWIDSERIGVEGWSYGGFMTISMMLRYPEVFRAGCAGGPVIDWKYYEVMYGERYMDTPESNPEGYKAASLLAKADKLQGKLLVIHGTMDPVVVWQNSLQFVKACIDAGKQLDYFVYPGHEHNVRGKDRIHMWKKISGYFDQNLK